MGVTNEQKAIILHGWTRTPYKWQPLLTLLKEKNINVQVPLIPALTTPIDKPWHIEYYIDWLKEIIDNCSEEITLICHSSGGRIGASYLAKHQDKVKNLVLMDVAGIYHKDLITYTKRAFFGLLAKWGKGRIKSKRLERLIHIHAYRSEYFEAEPNEKITMRNIMTIDYRKEFKKITTPTTIIWGEKDPMTPLSDGIEIHRLIKDSKLHIIKNARHTPLFTHPQQVCDIIVDVINNR